MGGPDARVVQLELARRLPVEGAALRTDEGSELSHYEKTYCQGLCADSLRTQMAQILSQHILPRSIWLIF